MTRVAQVAVVVPVEPSGQHNRRWGRDRSFVDAWVFGGARESVSASSAASGPILGDGFTRCGTRSCAGTSCGGRGSRCTGITARRALTTPAWLMLRSTALVGFSMSWPRICARAGIGRCRRGGCSSRSPPVRPSAGRVDSYRRRSDRADSGAALALETRTESSFHRRVGPVTPLFRQPRHPPGRRVLHRAVRARPVRAGDVRLILAVAFSGP